MLPQVGPKINNLGHIIVVHKFNENNILTRRQQQQQQQQQ